MITHPLLLHNPRGADPVGTTKREERPAMPRHTLPKAEREIAIRLQDRLNWEPGEPHKQDVLFEEAAAAREEIAPVLQAFQATLKQLETVLTTITGRQTLA